MPVDLANLIVGRSYNRPELAEIWGYQGPQALQRGVVTPKGQNLIILFVTAEKRKDLVQYRDQFDGQTLDMEGETNHLNDRRLANSLDVEDVHLFYRRSHREDFTYKGQIYLVEAELRTGDELSRFRFVVDRWLAEARSSLLSEAETYGLDEFIPDVEGRKRVYQHVQHERSLKNRAKALELHGNVCAACGFDFDAFYGADLAKGYIEVHHVTSITRIDGPVDPRTGLVPLCANCHRMAHRHSGTILTVDELRARIRRNAATTETLAEAGRHAAD